MSKLNKMYRVFIFIIYDTELSILLDEIYANMLPLRLTKKAEPPPTRDVNRDSGTASANGGWLRRLVRPLVNHRLNLNIIIAYNNQEPAPKAAEIIQITPESP